MSLGMYRCLIERRGVCAREEVVATGGERVVEKGAVRVGAVN